MCFFVFAFFTDLQWTRLSWIKWCHAPLGANQRPATFQSICGDSCGGYLLMLPTLSAKCDQTASTLSLWGRLAELFLVLNIIIYIMSYMWDINQVFRGFKANKNHICNEKTCIMIASNLKKKQSVISFSVIFASVPTDWLIWP